MILGMFVADLRQHTDFTHTGNINTDDRPYVEYAAPKNALRYTTDENQSALLHVFTPIPNNWLAKLDVETAARLQAEHDAVKLMLEGAVFRAQGDFGQAFSRLSQAQLISPKNPVVKNELVAMLNSSAQSFKTSGDLSMAAKQYQMALQLDPTDFWSLFHLVGLGMSADKPEFAKKMLDRGLEAYAESPLMIGLQGKYLFSVGERIKGVALLEKAARLHPGHLGLWKDLRMLASLSGNINIRATAEENIDRIEKFVEKK